MDPSDLDPDHDQASLSSESSLSSLDNVHDGILSTFQPPSLMTAHIRTSLSELDRILESIYPPMESTSTRSGYRDPGLRTSRAARVLSLESIRAHLDCAAILDFIPYLARTSSEGIKVIFALILEENSQQDLDNPMSSRRRAFLQGRADRDRSVEQLFGPINSGHPEETPTPYNSARLRAASPHSHLPDIPAHILTLEHILHIYSALWHHRRRNSEAEYLDLGAPAPFLSCIKNYFMNGARELTVVMDLDSERLFHLNIYNRPSDPTGAQVRPSENTLAAVTRPEARENPRGVVWNHRVTLERVLRETESYPEPEGDDYGVPVSEGESSAEPIEPRVAMNFDYFTMGARSVR